MYRNWHIETTTRCNLACRHCLLGHKKADSCAVEKSLRIVLDKIKDLGARKVSFTGGEPLVVEYFLNWCQYAHYLGIQPTFVTNGQCVNMLGSMKRKGIFKVIGVSIDGTPLVHDYIRGRGCYDRARQFIEQLVEYGVSVVAYITIHALNVDIIAEIMSNLINIGVRTFHFSQLNIQGNASDAQELWLQQSYEEIWKKVSKQISRVLNVKILWQKDDLCMISPSSLYIDHSGDIYPCVELSGRHRYSIVSIFDHNVRAKLDGYFKKIQKPSTCAYLTRYTDGVTILLNQRQCKLMNERKCHD